MIKHKLVLPEKHNYGIDLIRILSILLVIFAHIIEITIKDEGGSVVDIGCYSILHIFCRVFTTMFFCISGYFLLDKEYDTTRTKNFYIHHCLPLLACWEIWIVIYNIYFIACGQPFVGWLKFLGQLVFASVVPVNVQWYMSCILIVYLLVPIIANGIKKIDLLYVFAIAIIIWAASYMIFSPYLNFTYVNYVLAGYLVKKLYERYQTVNLKIAIAVLTALVFVGFSIYVWLVSTNHFTEINIPWFTDVFYFPLCFGLFAILMWLLKIKQNVFCYMGGNITFGLFLIHMPVYWSLATVIHFNNIWLTSFVCFITTVAISVAILLILSCIPYVGKYLIKTKPLKWTKREKPWE